MSEKGGQLTETAVSTGAVRDHLREVLESPAFKGSRRSQQFLHHIVEKSIEGRADQLKERNLGVEIFGRSPSYDTGEDAIVRVTASDVRKRLHQFYSETASDVRIDLHSGSYAPEFRQIAARQNPAAPVHTPRPVRWRLVIWVLAAALAVSFLGVSIWRGGAAFSARNVLPWSHLLQHDRQVVLVFSDPDISVIQKLVGSRLSLSDYANGRYLPQDKTFSPDLRMALQTLRGVNVPAVDVGIALSISRLANASSTHLRTQQARALKLSDFKTDDDFIILGSPRSNPWSGLFQDQLDFYFVHDQEFDHETIHNRHVRSGEQERYVPTARGWGTGHNFAIVALVSNPGQSGTVLLLAGTTAEGTEAAGKLAANPEALEPVLTRCGIDSAGPLRNFELLLDVRTMAGSPSAFDVQACHAFSSH